ncbi:MAG: hypothetical protein IKF80_08580 [Erysipelotrichaceae bacterium]|nr:hypothetical protein [Erysipelotrichaceae bacterium]
MDESTLKNYKNNVHYEDVVGSFIPDYATEEYPYECPIVDQHYTNLSFPI